MMRLLTCLVIGLLSLPGGFAVFADERPKYHFTIDGDGVPGDPNGAFYADGRYHLMCLYRVPAKPQSCYRWGHRSSTDLIHWTDHGDAIAEADGDAGAFSGGAFVDDDGTAYLSYWMIWGSRGIGLVKSHGKDYSKWSRCAANPVIRSTGWGIAEVEIGGQKKVLPVSDPSNIWKKGGRYYMLAGNLPIFEKFQQEKKEVPAEYRGDHLGLYVSDDLSKWEYVKDFYERRADESDATGWTDEKEDCMCATFLPLPSSPEGGTPSGKHLLSFIAHCRGCQYYVGTYDESGDRFLPEAHGRMSWRDRSYFAPEAMIDGRGRQLLWTWMRDTRLGQLGRDGWNGVYALPRSLWLRKDGSLGISVPLEYMRLPGTQVANPADGFDSDCCRIELQFDRASANRFELEVKRASDGSCTTVISYDDERGELVFDGTKSGHLDIEKFCEHVPVERAPFRLAAGEDLELTVFLDGRIVEVFANDRQAISRQVYPNQPSCGVRLTGAIPKRYSASRIAP